MVQQRSESVALLQKETGVVPRIRLTHRIYIYRTANLQRTNPTHLKRNGYKNLKNIINAVYVRECIETAMPKKQPNPES